MKNLAPVIVFTFDRPDHTAQTLKALSENDLSNQSILYIYCDGIKSNSSEKQKLRIKEVRKVVRQEQWCKEVHIIESDKNKGLANSIIDGVTDVINKHGKVIILEDDLISSPYFLYYMNSALDFYNKYPSVFSISANRPPLNKMKIPEDYKYDTFASLRNYSTGWATWKDRWNRVDWEMSKLDTILADVNLINAVNRGGDDLIDLIKMQREGKIDSWAVRFGLEHFVQHAVAILPCISYVDNIGFDGTGTHSGYVEDTYRNDLSKASSEVKFLDIIYQDSRIINAFYNAFTSKKRPIWQKAINRLSRIFGGKNIFVIKKKVYE